MLSIFIMLIIAIGLCAGIGYSILTLIKTGEVSLGIQKSQVRMEVVSSSIRAGLRYQDGAVLVPAKLSSGGKVMPVVPDIAAFKNTSYNLPITYCPLGSRNVATAPGDIAAVTEVGNPGVDAYPVKTVHIGNMDYVSGSDPQGDVAVFDKLREKNVVAFLIAPDPYTDETLECGDISFPPDQGENESVLTILVDGGSVTPIFGADSTPSRETISFSPGDDLGNIAERIDAIGLPETVIVVPYSPAEVDEGEESEPAAEPVLQTDLDDIRYLGAASGGRVLRISGTPAHPAIIKVYDQAASGKVEIPFDGDVFMSNVVFEGYADRSDTNPSFDVVLTASRSGRLFLDNVVANGLHVDGGRIAVTGDESLIEPYFGASGEPVVVNGGDLSVAAASSPKSVVIAPAATTVFTVNGGHLLFEGQPMVDTSATAKLIGRSGNARVAGTVAGQDVDLYVVRGANPPAVEKAYSASGLTVTETCSDGSGSCQAMCPSDMAVVSGRCGSTDGHPLSGFGAFTSETDDATGYKCEWAMAGTDMPVSPVAEAICR